MIEYRREIDGLRGFAVLAVIIYHASLYVPLFGNHLFKGGYVGVDVFFVISGYLITSIILKERKLGTFTFSDYGHWTREGAIFFSNKISHSEWIPILDSKLSDE